MPHEYELTYGLINSCKVVVQAHQCIRLREQVNVFTDPFRYISVSHRKKDAEVKGG
jgi:hypothetical protein